MKVVAHFDSGICPPFEVEEDEITFDLRQDVKFLNVLLVDVSSELNVVLLIRDEEEKFLKGQGLIARGRDADFVAFPLAELGKNRLCARISGLGTKSAWLPAILTAGTIWTVWLPTPSERTG